MIEEYEGNYLENIIHGNEVKRTEDIATTARNYLCRSFQASKMDERKFDYFQRIKREQESILEQLCTEKNWWFLNLTRNNFLTEGGESKFFFKDKSNYVQIPNVLIISIQKLELQLKTYMMKMYLQ
jgi:hypothetical protein